MAQLAEVSLLLLRIVRSLVDDEDAVMIEHSESGRWVNLRVSVAAQDVGKLIGRQGRTIYAIRAILGMAGAVSNLNVRIEILEPQ
jgi:predicted RNA-binding protein YlqC (UPF0109 family)